MDGNTDLSNINVTVKFDVDTSYTDNLKDKKVDIADDKTLTISAVKVSDVASVTGDGNIAITGMDGNTDLSNINVNGNYLVIFTEDTTCDKNLDNFFVHIEADVNLTISAENISGALNVTGSGNIIITDMNNTDLSNIINVEGTVTYQV